MSTLITLFLVFALLVIWRSLHQKRALELYLFRLEKLKNQMFWLAVEGKVDSSSEVYIRLNGVICNRIHSAWHLTIFSILMYYMKYGTNDGVNSGWKKFQDQLSDYPELVEISQKLTEISFIYLVSQHYVTGMIIQFFSKLFQMPGRVSRFLESIIKETIAQKIDLPTQGV